MILGVLAVGNTLILQGILRQGNHLHYDNITPPPHIYAVPFTLFFSVWHHRKEQIIGEETEDKGGRTKMRWVEDRQHTTYMVSLQEFSK